MTRKREALPNPEMLVWARRSSAMPLEVAADKLGIGSERLKAWESGSERPTIPQLRHVGTLYRRPLAAFYYPSPPKLPPKLRDMRLLPALANELDWVDLSMEARTARERRAMLLEVLEAQGEILPELKLRVRLGVDPEGISVKVRETLGVTLEGQAEPETDYESLAYWRACLENKGVLVLQTGNLSITTARGFSIPEFPLPVIVINRSDSPLGRVFTMMHELVHIMLRLGGVCDMDYRDWRPPTEQKIEVFCNHVAGAALVPRERLMSIPLVAARKTDADWKESDFIKLSRLFGVSREVIVRRLLILGRVSPELYQARRDEYVKEYQRRDDARSQKGGFLPPASDVVSTLGSRYVSLVLDAWYNEALTRSDLADYFGVRLKHVPRIEELARRQQHRS